MSGKRARQRRREALVEGLRELVDEDLARHLVKNQLEPQFLADDLRRQGHDVDVSLVNVSPNAEDGFEVSCVGCGRTARMPFEPPAGKVVLCPRCQRDRVQ